MTLDAYSTNPHALPPKALVRMFPGDVRAREETRHRASSWTRNLT
jgi:hypothetical protein